MKISLCITCYDQDYHHVESRILELEQQTRYPDEVLVVCSGLEKLEVSDPNVKVYTFPARMLPGGARNKGGELATGDVVSFCDTDDPMHPQKIEILGQIFKNEAVDALVHDYGLDSPDFAPIPNTEEIEIEQVTEVDERWEKEQNHIFDPHSGSVVFDGEKMVSHDIPHTCVKAPSNRPLHHGHISAKKEVFADLKYREDMWLGEDGDFCQSIVKSPKYSLYYTPLSLINYYTE